MAISRAKGRKTWMMDFFFAGQRIYESTGTKSKTLAKEIEKKRRSGLESGAAGIRRREVPRILSVAAADWLELKRNQVAPRTHQIEQQNLRHILPVLGKLLVCDIEPRDVSRYQQARLDAGASPKTINLEVGTLRAILKRGGAWARIQPEVKMLPADDNVGRAITPEEETALLAACSASRSRSLHTFVSLALATGARFNVVRTLQWGNVNLEAGTVRWGKDKTAAGSGRTVPLSARAQAVMQFWADQFPDRGPSDYVFPKERYGGAGRVRSFGFSGGHAYAVDPSRPVGDIKEAWEAAKKRAGVQCRFHDLRHSAASRMLAAGNPLPKVARILGWSPATAVRMAARYGHFSMDDLRGAVEAITPRDADGFEQGSLTLSRTVAAMPPQVQTQVVEKIGSSGRTRTYNPPVNSRMLCH